MIRLKKLIEIAVEICNVSKSQRENGNILNINNWFFMRISFLTIIFFITIDYDILYASNLIDQRYQSLKDKFLEILK